MRVPLFLLLPLMLGACAAPRPVAPAPQPVTPQAPPVPIPPPPPRGEPAQFGDISAAQLKAMLGNPAFTRNDGATQMWRYDGQGCQAFFFLYGAGAQQRVRHVETLPAGREVAADPACLSTLKKG